MPTPPIADLARDAFTPEGADVASFLAGLVTARLRLLSPVVLTVEGGAVVDAVVPVFGTVRSARLNRIVVTPLGATFEFDGLGDRFVPFPQ